LRSRLVFLPGACSFKKKRLADKCKPPVTDGYNICIASATHRGDDESDVRYRENVVPCVFFIFRDKGKNFLQHLQAFHPKKRVPTGYAFRKKIRDGEPFFIFCRPQVAQWSTWAGRRAATLKKISYLYTPVRFTVPIFMRNSILQFKKIALSDLPTINRIVATTPYQSCQLSAGGLYCLSEKYATEVSFCNDFLFVKQRRRGFGTCYFMPVGAGNLPEAVRRLLACHAATHGGDLAFWGVADDMLSDFRSASKELANAQLTPDRDWAEYIHLSKNLLSLSGKRLQPKRNAVNQFLRSYGRYVYEPVSPSNVEEVWAFQRQQFESGKAPENNATLPEEENRAIAIALAAWEEIGLTGGLIRIDGEVKAFAFGCPIGARTFDIMFESADHRYNGVFQVLEQELIKRRLSDFPYINREEDLGIPGLRFAKQGLRPDMLLMKYSTKIPANAG
jgi:hypothetical protein